MKVSVVFGIYNRGELLTLGLESLARQTLPASEFEVLIVDNESTEDLSQVCQPYVGKLNLRHIYYSKRNHWLIRELFPGKPSSECPHTPAISHNLGIKRAQGEVVAITQSEVIHHPDSLRRGYELATTQKNFHFADMVMTSRDFTSWYKQNHTAKFEGCWVRALQDGTHFNQFENYWFLAFIERDAFFTINGIEEWFCGGVCGEDDHCKYCLNGIGYQEKKASNIQAFHLNHDEEAKLYVNQNRDADPWKSWAIRNRTFLDQWRNDPNHSFLNNQGHTWGDPKLIEWVREYHVTPDSTPRKREYTEEVPLLPSAHDASPRSSMGASSCRPIIFALPRHPYDSYTEFRALPKLSGFPTCWVDEMDLAADMVYITSPWNGDLEAHLNNHGRARKAKLILWCLERPSNTDPQNFVSHVNEIWSSDRHMANLWGVKYVPMGSHPGLSLSGRRHWDQTDFSYDYIHLSAPSYRRSHIFGTLAKERGTTLAPNSWGVERDANLLASRMMLNVHQDDYPCMEPLRLVLAAAYGIPLLTEHGEDPWPLTEEHIVMVHYDQLIETAVRYTTVPLDQIPAKGLALYKLLCEEMPFERTVKDGVYGT